MNNKLKVEIIIYNEGHDNILENETLESSPGEYKMYKGDLAGLVRHLSSQVFVEHIERLKGAVIDGPREDISANICKLIVAYDKYVDTLTEVIEGTH